MGNGGCGHICINLPGSFICSCKHSYTLKPDGTCVPFPNHADAVFHEPNGHICFPDPKCTSNLSCTWIIDLTTSYKRIMLTFKNMSIDCGKHQVMVLNGKDEDSFSLGSYCGNNTPNPIRSSTEAVTIKFITDGTVNTNQFCLQYEGLKHRGGKHNKIFFNVRITQSFIYYRYF